MEEEAADLDFPDLDELDDLFQDGDLFKDLEALGEVLDELEEAENEDSDGKEVEIMAQFLPGEAKPAILVNLEPDETIRVKEEKDKCSNPSDLTKNNADKKGTSGVSGKQEEKEFEGYVQEIEDGEILEDDEKLELKDLRKQKAVIVEKMKKLVRHKIQLTTKRNDLLQQVKAAESSGKRGEYDRVNIQLKENSQLVKAISNMIFRMNPEIKSIDSKIKELEASIGPGITKANVSTEVPLSKASLTPPSQKDLKHIQKFFGKITNEEKKKEKRADEGIPSEKDEGVKKTSTSESSKTVARFSSQVSSTSLNNTLSISPMKKPSKLITDNNKIKKLFEKVCEMSDRCPKRAPETQEESKDKPEIKKEVDVDMPVIKKEKDIEVSNEQIQSDARKLLPNPDRSVATAEKIQLNIGRIQTRNDRIPVNDDKIKAGSKRILLGSAQTSLGSLESHITSKLKELREQSTPNVLVRDQGEVSNRKHIDVETRSLPMKTDSVVGDKPVRKMKRPIEFNVSESNSFPAKKIKDFESNLTKGISKSLLGRLGSAPSNNNRQEALSSAGSLENQQMRDFAVERRESFWCNYCRRAFKSSQIYIMHLESLGHLNTAGASTPKKDKKSFMTDTDASLASKDDVNEDVEWYKGLSKANAKTISPSAEATKDDNLCITVIGSDSFCTLKVLGFSHPRCFTHAECLARSKDQSVTYIPNKCPVCSEYLRHCHTSKKCCERIFRIFKFFKKRFGLNFDWDDSSVKDWFFDNYRKLQSTAADEESSAVSYEDFQKLAAKANADKASESDATDQEDKVMSR